jgi:hypothetical protein
MRDPLNPFEDVEEEVQGPYDHGDKIKFCDRNGQPHRLDGPAVEHKQGGKKIWALHGQEVTEQQVAAYRLKLEAEGERRRKEAHSQMVEAEAEQYHTGLETKTKVNHALELEKSPKPPKLPKVWG